MRRGEYDWNDPKMRVALVINYGWCCEEPDLQECRSCPANLWCDYRAGTTESAIRTEIKEIECGEERVKTLCEEASQSQSVEQQPAEQAVQPARQGHWIFGGGSFYDHYCRCSVCDDISEKSTPFCPWCGAEMRGLKDV